eukprot:jgi/Chrzof1/1156/Cz01g42190.t1
MALATYSSCNVSYGSRQAFTRVGHQTTFGRGRALISTCKSKPAATAASSAAPTVTETSTNVQAALEAIRRGQPVCILDSRTREGETDIYYPGLMTYAPALRQLRTQAGGELYIAVGHEVATAFGLPYAGAAMAAAAHQHPVLAGMSKFDDAMCQGSCSVGISLDHRSTKTGAPDDERSLTVRRLAELTQQVLREGTSVEEAAALMGKEFHLPGHIFLCQENPGGLSARQGHTELSIALARRAGVTPVMVGCVMLSNSGDDYGALGPDAAREWAMSHGVPFLEGPEILEM